MKKIISILSTLSIATSSILASCSSIKTESKINNLENKNTSEITNNKLKDNDDIQSGDYWYAPNVKVNNLNNNPIANSGLSIQEQQYCDFVFLKSIYGDSDNNKDKTTIEINYSLSNILDYDTKYDSSDASQDVQDFKIMENQKDAYGHLGIEEGKSLLDRYLNNDLLSFNSNGYIPPRNAYFSSLYSNNINDVPKQTIITNNYSKTNKQYNFSLSDYLSVNLHWYGIDLKIGYKLADPIIYGLMNLAIQSAYLSSGVAIYTSAEILKDKIKDLVEEEVEKVISFIAKDTLALDAEEPEVEAVILSVSAILSEMICYEINKQIDSLVDQCENLLDDLKNTCENKLQTLEGSQKLSIDFDTTWILVGTKININKVDDVKIVTENTLTPAQVNPIMHRSTLLVGTTNDFIAIFDASDWRDVSERIWDNHYPVEYINSFGMKNPNINLTDNDWEKDILPSLVKKYHYDATRDGYSFLMHIVNKQVVYANINNDGTTNMPYVDSAEHIEELFSGTLNNNNLILDGDQFASLMYSYNYDEKNWTEIKNKNHPSETNANDYFYDNSINNRFWIDNSITKNKILTEINNFNNAIKIPDTLNDIKSKNTFTFSQFVEITSNKKQILNIPSSIGIDGVKK